jgi:hypothetical protein
VQLQLRALERALGDLPAGGERDAAPVRLASWCSAGGKGAMACLGLLPCAATDARFALGGEEYQKLLRRHLGIERAPPGGRCPNCGAAQSGAHTRSCSKSLNSDRHHSFVRTLLPLLKEDGKLLRAQCECQHCFRPEHRANKQMDIWFSAGQLDTPVPTVQPCAAKVASGVCAPLLGGLRVSVCLDFTLRDGTCGTYRAAASRDVVQGLVAASETKVQKYVETGSIDTATTTLISLAYDQFGSASRDTHAFFRAVAVHQAQHSAGLYTVASCVARWRQRLSALLQRIISDQVVAAWETTASVPGQPPSDLSAFRRIHLPCPQAARAPPAPPRPAGAAYYIYYVLSVPSPLRHTLRVSGLIHKLQLCTLAGLFRRRCKRLPLPVPAAATAATAAAAAVAAIITAAGKSAGASSTRHCSLRTASVTR